MRSRSREDFETYGDVYFITSTVVGFINIFSDKQASEIFVDCLRFYQERGDFILLAWVLMPNHFHLIAKKADSSNISEIIGGIKRYTARQIGLLRGIPELCSLIDRIRQAALSEPGKGTAVWKPRFDSYVIKSEDVLKQKIEYIHNNPVRKGLVKESWQWRYSSAAAYIGKVGIDLPVDFDWSCLGYDRMPSGKDS